MADAKPTTLYRLFGEDDELLYVGIAGNPGRRFQQHAFAKKWWHRVAVTTLEHFESRADALEAERAAIEAERPLYNIVHSTRDRVGELRDAFKALGWTLADVGVCNKDSVCSISMMAALMIDKDLDDPTLDRLYQVTHHAWANRVTDEDVEFWIEGGMSMFGFPGLTEGMALSAS